MNPLAYLAELAEAFSPRPRHIGDGQKRAVVREHQHRQHQAARVAPALPAFADRRADLARKRVRRWDENHPDLTLADAPTHIKRMTRERRA